MWTLLRDGNVVRGIQSEKEVHELVQREILRGNEMELTACQFLQAFTEEWIAFSELHTHT